MTKFMQVWQRRWSWAILSVLFGVGSVIAVVGLALFAQHVQRVEANSTIKVTSYLGVATAAFGALCWVIIVYNRAALSLQEVGGNLGINSWLFPSFTLLTQIGLMGVGVLLIEKGYPAWQGCQ